MTIVLLLSSVGRFFANILYLSNTHKLRCTLRMDEWLLYIAAYYTGKYIVIKVEYGLQLHFKIFLTNQIEKTTTKIIIKMLMILDFKILTL